MYKETKMRMADFAPETVKARRQEKNIFKNTNRKKKKEKRQLTSLYPVKYLSKIKVK